MMEEMADLLIPLPEELAKAKCAGDFPRAEAIIRAQLADPDTPQVMRRRLRLEREVLRRLPGDYPYSEAEGLRLIQAEIPDFTLDELRAYESSGAADFIYRDGEPYLNSSFYESMKAADPSLLKLAGKRPDDSERQTLDAVIGEMRENGYAARRIRLKHTLRIRDEAFTPGTVLVHLPVPAACRNIRGIRILDSHPAGGIVDEAEAGARTIAFTVDLRENEPFSVEYEYDAVAYDDVFRPRDCPPPDRNADLAQQAPHIIFSPMVQAMCRELKGTLSDPLAIARRFYDFITTKVRYSYMREYFTLPPIADYCLARRRGDCGVQALTFITLCRCAGIPARWQSGWFVLPDRTPHPHDWAEFYAAPYGWLFADLSVGGSLFQAQDQAGWDHYFGRLDPFRMAANREFSAPLHPLKRHYRFDPYDNQVGEVETETRGLLSSEFESRRELIAMERIVLPPEEKE